MSCTRIIIFDLFLCRCPHCPPERVDKEVDLNKIEFHLLHHSENLYGCQYCDYIDFNRDEMRTHMRNIHLLQLASTHQSNIIVIRQTMQEDYSIDKNRRKSIITLYSYLCTKYLY